MTTTTTAIEVTRYETVDDYACGVEILWDVKEQVFILRCIEAGYEIARTVSPAAAVVYTAAALIEYGEVADGDWSATVAQGREMLTDLDRHIALLIAARDSEVSRWAD